MTRYLVCVDDTDDLTKSTSTGKISQKIAEAGTKRGGQIRLGITRHQLLIHEDIPYTSHNSSMCFEIEIDPVSAEILREEAEEILLSECASSADPGLCFCRLDHLRAGIDLVAFGSRAQQEVLTKGEAYQLAFQVGGTFLNEYGGTGQGVIGALAGVGLRLAGCDGTFRGGKAKKYAGQTLTADELMRVTDATQVITLEKALPVPDATPVLLPDKAKCFLRAHQQSIIVKHEQETYVCCGKNDLYATANQAKVAQTACYRFELDNDPEECLEGYEGTCVNCLHRRWAPLGLTCENPAVS